MAVSVDTVYQRVLAIANKEQKGYITPQEYNLLANANTFWYTVSILIFPIAIISF